MNLMIEEKDDRTVDVTVDDPSLDAAKALLLLELARLSILSAYVSGEEPQPVAMGEEEE